MTRGMMAGLLAGAAVAGAFGAETVEIAVDCAEVVGTRAYPERYLNNSIMHAPPPALADRMVKEYGRPKIVRCWLQLEKMWNRKTGTYDFNHRIPRRVYQDAHRTDKPDGTAITNRVVYATEKFEDYLDAFSRNSEEILLNIRAIGLDDEAAKGTFPMSMWKEVFEKGLRHYKERYPNIRYVEVLNEAEAASKFTCDQYYPFYQAAYGIVGKLNSELKPAVPLSVGGPCTCSFNKKFIDRFLDLYAQDTDPRKRLDFLSFHDYSSMRNPSIYGTFEEYFRGRFLKAGLPGNLPIFMTEVGVGGGSNPTPDPERNRMQAVAETTYVYYARHSANLHVFPWVLFHLRRQLCYAQFTQELNMTPFGAAVKAWSLHKDREIGTVATPVATNLGVYAMASLDDTGAAIQVWNYQAMPDKTHPEPGPSAVARVAIRNLPAKWAQSKLRVRQYLIDSVHSNCFAGNKEGSGQLQQVSCVETEAKALEKLTVNLEPNAICLWLVDAP